MANLNLKHFAKIENSDFDIQDITVFTGKPGSGKSYIMKFHYAHIEAMSSILNGKYKTHYALMDSEDIDQSLLQLSRKFINNVEINGDIEANDYISAYEKIKTLDLNEDGFEALLKRILENYSNKQKKALLANDAEKFHLIFKNILRSIFLDINQINYSFEYHFDDLGLEYKNDAFEIKNLKINPNIMNAIFVETPLILEFENFLPKERFKVPYHIDSLLEELRGKDYTFTSEESDSFINQFQKVTQEIIDGNIVKNANDFSFKSSQNKVYSIVNASSGIKSIGLLQYLVTNKALKKGSTLFWEEPEVHLHPTWQLKMVDLFIELMKAGVKIVFSTHSPFMADYLNAKAQKEKFHERVSFNLLNEKDGVVANTILDEDNWSLLQSELMDSFEDIMWQYL